MRCGLHYVRFCDLRTKRCAAAPANQAAAKAIADALAGGPLTRRKVHAFARHPSGSRPGAPGARLPSDVITLDPHAPRPAGPAYPQAQGGDTGSQEGGTPGGDPQHVLVADDPGHPDVLGPPPGPQGVLDRGTPGQTTRPKVGAPARPRECRPAGIPEGTTPPVLGSRKFMPPWAWNATKRAPARAAKGGSVAEGPGTCAPCWASNPRLASQAARGEHRPRCIKMGGRRSPKPSAPHAGRPTNGPVSPGGCLGRRGIPGATSSVGSRLASPPSRWAREAAPHRRVSLRAMPRSAPAR